MMIAFCTLVYNVTKEIRSIKKMIISVTENRISTWI